MKKWDRRGFSLMEMMVVVGIMAVITMIALPSYRSFKAKAEQKEGFNLLTIYYTKAHAARAEFGIFPGEFVQTGFAPVGELGYRLRADDNPNNTTMSINNQDSACTRTFNDCDCGGRCLEFKTWTERGGGRANLGVAGVQPSSCGGNETTDDTFKAGVAGWINNTAARPDKYEINQAKTITMCQDGLK